MEHKDLALKHLCVVDDITYFISTIKMEVRHSWLNQQNNLFVYESMVFKMEEDEILYHQPIYNQRYNNYDRAINGHQTIIDDIKIIVKDK